MYQTPECFEVRPAPHILHLLIANEVRKQCGGIETSEIKKFPPEIKIPIAWSIDETWPWSLCWFWNSFLDFGVESGSFHLSNYFHRPNGPKEYRMCYHNYWLSQRPTGIRSLTVGSNAISYHDRKFKLFLISSVVFVILLSMRCFPSYSNEYYCEWTFRACSCPTSRILLSWNKFDYVQGWLWAKAWKQEYNSVNGWKTLL